MHPRRLFHLSQPNLEVHYGSGKAEYLKQYKSFIAMYSDADLARELKERRSTTSMHFSQMVQQSTSTYLNRPNPQESPPVQNYLPCIKESSK
eukprot:5048553-Ditylum_brightwellii.AAC.1